MSTPSQTFAVALDSCVFFDKDSWQLSQEAFLSLLDLAASGIVRIIMVDIVRHETKNVISRLSPKVWEAHRVHRATFGGASYSLEEVGARLLAEFDRFCDRTELVGTSNLTAGRIFELYWNHRPPFGKGTKRNEFPDAFALVALTEWAETNGELRVVSDDGDWRDSCEGNLKYHKTLQDLLAYILKRSGDAVMLSRILTALKNALLDIDEVIDAQINLDSTTVVRREGGHPLKQSDVQCEYHVGIDKIVGCSIFSLPQTNEEEPRRISATVELDLKFRLNCEVDNPDTEEDPSAPPSLDITTKFAASREFSVHAIYDPIDRTCRITDLLPFGDWSFAFELRHRGERWMLVEDGAAPAGAA